MTELEKIAYAKIYVDKLANGINPLTEQQLPDSDIINNVKISRCLFYVSAILGQVRTRDLESSDLSQKSCTNKHVPFW